MSPGQIDRVIQAAAGYWLDVLADLAPELQPAIASIGKHVPCPMHGGKDGFRLFPDVEKTGGGVCNTCGTFRDGIHLLSWLRGDSLECVAHEVSIFIAQLERTSAPEREPERAPLSKVERSAPLSKAEIDALDVGMLERIWDQATPAHPGLTAYLRERGLSEGSPDVLRLHTSLANSESSTMLPAMVARVTRVDGSLVALHRTYLDPLGSGKAPVSTPKKLTPPIYPGATRGAAVHLQELDSEDETLAIAEGIETGLAVLEATGYPVWASVSAGGMRTIEVPDQVKEILIYADNDRSGTGQEAARVAAKRLRQEGKNVRILVPPVLHSDEEKGTDWLDVLVKLGREALTDSSDSARAHERMELGDILNKLVAFIERYVAFPVPQSSDVVALWIALTYVFEQFELCPYLAVTSPEKRSGKTRVLDVLDLLCSDPWRVVSPSEAVMFRKIARDKPTLLLDEADTVFGHKPAPNAEGLRALFNAGNRRGTTIPRVTDVRKGILEDFDVYCPKAFAGIGRLPDTIEDRSITIRMARKRPGEEVARFRHRAASLEAEVLRDLLIEWSTTWQMSDHWPELPYELDDRAQDAWEPLLALADHAGGDWPTRARAAATGLAGARVEDVATRGIQVLADIRGVLEELGVDRVPTTVLIHHLVEIEDSPWADLTSGKPLDGRRLADLLRPYDIRPAQHRFEERTLKGYLRSDFEDAWNRYLGVGGAVSDETAKQPSAQAESDGKHIEPDPDSQSAEDTGATRHSTRVSPSAETNGDHQPKNSGDRRMTLAEMMASSANPRKQRGSSHD